MGRNIRGQEESQVCHLLNPVDHGGLHPAGADVIAVNAVGPQLQGEITPGRMRAMEIIQDALTLFFKDNDTENSMHDTYQKVFIGELLSSRI